MACSLRRASLISRSKNLSSLVTASFTKIYGKAWYEFFTIILLVNKHWINWCFKYKSRGGILFIDPDTPNVVFCKHEILHSDISFSVWTTPTHLSIKNWWLPKEHFIWIGGIWQRILREKHNSGVTNYERCEGYFRRTGTKSTNNLHTIYLNIKFGFDFPGSKWR